jgi:alkylation response protein AidB-like acyl-CoA dehydrogenase
VAARAFTDPVAAARAVRGVVAGRRAWAEAHCRLAPVTVSALAAAGLFRLVAPREVGGWEASLVDQLAVCEELGAADPSAAWCVTNAAVAGRAAAHLSDEARALVFGDPGASYAFSNLVTGTAVEAEGGYRLSGRWPVVSGASHATWAVLGARLAEDGGAGADPVRWMLVPSTSFAVEETWSNAMAMRGSGSHTVVVAEAFVRGDLAHSWLHPRRIDRPLYRMRQTSVTGTTSAAIALGVLREAVSALVELLSGYRSSLDGAAPRDWANVQQAVAELTASSRAARAGLFEAAAEVWGAVEAGGEVPAVSRAGLFAAADHAVQVALAGVSRAFVCGTGRAIEAGSVLERSLRDAHGMAINWERVRRMVYDAGNVLLGGEPRFRAM